VCDSLTHAGDSVDVTTAAAAPQRKCLLSIAVAAVTATAATRTCAGADVATHCNALRHTGARAAAVSAAADAQPSQWADGQCALAAHGNTLQRAGAGASAATLQRADGHAATTPPPTRNLRNPCRHSNTLQNTATHCNTLKPSSAPRHLITHELTDDTAHELTHELTDDTAHELTDDTAHYHTHDTTHDDSDATHDDSDAPHDDSHCRLVVHKAFFDCQL